jgi:predicted CxxxxCH...CXXCH cytochrome family protein
MGKKFGNEVREVGAVARLSQVTALTVLLSIFMCLGWHQPSTALAAASPLLHSSDNLGTKYGTWGTTFTCATCHAENTQANVKLVAGSAQTPIGPRPVTFLQMTAAAASTAGVFGDDLRTYAQNGSTNICEVCHHQTTHHQYSSAKIADRVTNPHYNRQNCATSCHSHSNGFKASGCDGCHGNPPVTASIGGGALNGLATPATGATSPASPGAHQQHAVDMAMKCATCHNGTVMPTLDNTLHMGFAATPTNVPGFVGSFSYGSYTGHTLSAPYTGYGASAGTAIGVSTTSYQNSCNVYCHGNWTGNGGSIGNPSWVGGASQGACGSCHGVTSAAPPTAGSHGKHAATYGYSCTKCHPHVTTAQSHVKGSVQWRLSSAANSIISSAATYTAAGQAAAAAGATGTLAPSAVYGSCANLYCHSSGQNLATPAAPRTVPTWGATLGCSDCHGNSSGTLTSGSHAKHVAGASCEKCHYLTASSPISIKNSANHVNGVINVAFETNSSATTGALYGGVATPRTKTPDNGASYGSCSNIICHSNGQSIWTGSVGSGTTPTWGTSGDCSKCHGNSTYPTDYRRGAPLYLSGSPKPNAHLSHVDTRAALGGLEPQCAHCHATVTASNNAVDGTVTTNHANGAYSVTAGSTFRDADSYGTSTAPVAVTLTYSYNGSPNSSSCANVSCHPTGLNDANKAATSVAWNDKYQCTDCHKVDLVNTSGYHHAMRNYSAAGAAYPTTVPQGDATTGTNSNSRRCTMCHVDHTISSPLQNSSNSSGRAANLRTGITVTPTTAGGYTNSDYLGSTGGICISCHNGELTKSTTRLKTETASTKTAAIVFGNFSDGSHQYAVASVMNSPDNGGTFQANCSKCHNSRSGETAAFSSLTTATHDSPVRRLYANLGGNLTDGIDALFCYRCHSRTTDAIGGNVKSVSGKDYYATATMRTSAEDVFSTMATIPANPGTDMTGNVLYFRNSAASGTLPSAWLLASGTYSPTAPSISTRQYDMTPGTANAAQTSIADNMTSTTNPRYAHKLQFISPPIKTGFTWASGASFTLKINVQGPTGVATTYTRYAVYQRTAAGGAGTNFKTVANSAYLWTTTNATDSIAFTSTSAVTFAAGDRIVVELEVYRASAITGNYTMYWNGADGASLTLPDSRTFTVGATPVIVKQGHHVEDATYAGKHKTSPTDETLAYISANKHVSCNDCHDPHEARFGNHSTNGIARGSRALKLPNVLKGAVGTRYAAPVAWTKPTQASYSSLRLATREYQICFKCHSGAIDLAGSWFRNMTSSSLGAAKWTDLGLEFNPANKSGHPIMIANGATGSGSTALAAAQLGNGWKPGDIMTCTDCHATDSTASKGPHGSSVKWMLAGVNKAWPYTTAAANGTNSGTFWTLGTAVSGSANGLFCMNCHPSLKTTNTPHANGQHNSYNCVGCHIRVPHGGKIQRLINTNSAGRVARYSPDGAGATAPYLNTFVKASTYNGYIETGQCYSTNGSCSNHNVNTTTAW